MDILDYKLCDLKGKTALVTGASSGIGEATAYLLASHGVNLKLVARRQERLENIKENCAQNFADISVDYVTTDINATDAMDKLKAAGCFNVDICINNAGLALGKDTVETGNPADWDLMLATNVQSAFKVVHHCLTHMKKNGGDIISLGSIAGHEFYQGGAVYCASKAAIRAFMTSLRKETYGEDIRVMLLSPGMVNTEFSTVRFKGNKNQADDTYKGLTPMSALDIAHHVIYMLSRPRHVNIDNLLTLATDQGSATLAKRR
jgi:3-hydroxy acid dehydrogenase/malonic semialdehyde reductase